MAVPWILISILILIILLGIAAIYVKRKTKSPPDYYNLFIIGLIWAIFGLFMMDNLFFFMMGIVFMSVALSHKDKWKKNRRDWKKMSKEEKKFMIAVMIVLAVLVVAGLVALLLTKGGCIK